MLSSNVWPELKASVKSNQTVSSMDYNGSNATRVVEAQRFE